MTDHVPPSRRRSLFDPKIHRTSACALFYELPIRCELAKRGFHRACAQRRAQPADLLHRKRRLIRRKRGEQGISLSTFVRRVDVVLNVLEFSADGLCRMRIQDLMALQYIVRRVFQIELLLALRLMNGGDIGNDLRIPFLIFHGNIVECAHLFLLTKNAFLVNYSRFYEKSQWCWEILQERQGHPKRADGTERRSTNRSIFLLKKQIPIKDRD